MEFNITLVAPLPCRWQFSYFTKLERRYSLDTIEEIRGLSGQLEFRDYNDHSFLVSAEVFDKVDKYKPLATVRKKHLISSFPCIFLKLSALIRREDKEIEESFTRSDGSPISQENREQFVSQLSVEALDERLFEVALAANLARPSGLHYDAPMLFVNDVFLKYGRGVATSFSDAMTKASELKWPRFKKLKIKAVLDWFDQIPGFSDRRSETPLGRALAAYSYLMRSDFGNEGPLALVWALLGLEALYGKGNQASKSQLLTKSEAYLGTRLQHKKRYSWMYDFRSRLVHGDLDLIYAHNQFDATEAHERFSEGIWDCEMLATSMLLATLQKMCSENRISLDFRYKVLTSEK